METVVTEHKKRKPKTSDKDLKEYFSDYKTAQERMKQIKKHLISRPLTQEEENQISECEEIIKLNEDIANALDEREASILKGFYLEKIQLQTLCGRIWCEYEYTSTLKVEMDNKLRRIIEGNTIVSPLGNKLMNSVKDYLATMK